MHSQCRSKCFIQEWNIDSEKYWNSSWLALNDHDDGLTLIDSALSPKHCVLEHYSMGNCTGVNYISLASNLVHETSG